MDLKDPRLTGLAFRVLPVVQDVARELGKGASDAEVVGAVSERVKTLEAGLAPEKEFISAVNWLGRVSAITRIDQTPIPASRPEAATMKLPDILCVAVVDDRQVPLLIEVKRSESELVWSEKYLSGLRAFSSALNMPLLVAWKYHHIWSLVEVRHFEKKVEAYHLTFERAMKENLMSKIFGDALVMLSQRIAFCIDAEILDGPVRLPQPPELIPPGPYNFKIKGAQFLLDDGPIELPDELAWAFFRAPDDNMVTVTGNNTVRMIHTPVADTSFSMTDLALMLLLWDQNDEPDWEAVLRKSIPISASNVREKLHKGIGMGVVRYVLLQRPVTEPEFLKPGAPSSA